MKRRIELVVIILIVMMILIASIIFNNRIRNESLNQTKNNSSNTTNEIYLNEIDMEKRKELEREVEKANQLIKAIHNSTK